MDTACMFLITALIVVGCHHGWSVTKNDKKFAEELDMEKIKSNDYVYRHMKISQKRASQDQKRASQDHMHAKKPIIANQLFLYFMCPLLIFNFVGSILDTKEKASSTFYGMESILIGIFFPLQIGWMAVLILWAIVNDGQVVSWQHNRNR